MSLTEVLPPPADDPRDLGLDEVSVAVIAGQQLETLVPLALAGLRQLIAAQAPRQQVAAASAAIEYLLLQLTGELAAQCRAALAKAQAATPA